MDKRSLNDTSEKSESYKSLQKALKERLKDLRVKRGLTHDELLKEFNEFSNRKYGIVTTKENLKNYASAKAIPRIDMLCAIADFFGVSVDYLIGRSKYTQVSNELVGEEYGLSDEALIGIKNLKISEYAIMSEFVELYEKGMKRTYTGTPLSLLNYFLSSELLITFLDAFLQYTFPIHHVPVFFDEQTNEWTTPKDKFSHFATGNEWNLFLATSSEKPYDHQGVQINKHFLEGVAKYDIDKTLIQLRQGYISSIVNGLKKPNQWRYEDD